MLTRFHIESYRGPALERGDSSVYLAPHPLLRPYVPCYTLTCPVNSGMAEDYTILPTASTTLVFSIGENRIDANLRGVNTVASVVGGHALHYEMLLLIEFHPGALGPFIQHSPGAFTDISAALENLDRALRDKIEAAIVSADSVGGFIRRRGEVLLRSLQWPGRKPQFLEAVTDIT